MQLVRAVCALAAAASALLLILFFQARSLREGQLAAGTCEIVTLDRDSSQPRRTIARQTARCACRKGQIAGTTRASPACVDGKSQAAFIQALVPLYPSPLEHTRVASDPRDYAVCSPKGCMKHYS
ncbi:hypothetical protein PDJAM_G00253930 [Pangasius djambal]|uniref:Uncharacterized protein n=1 Tax=Pangasius djambal TaxID=1691987 RepID=A0ACC5YK55_9TELE|nr:hypothetical protein [Pangasius djambal]